ncbi:MAG: DUF3990 domain-containing protein [Parasporobacterium sp.]|nr:DUF3990 domain-containing protein [Parasporobacterium sp.]
MENITLFHGSEKIISRPSLEEGCPFNDFGRGFYCTPESTMAGQWACHRGASGFICSYSLDIDDLKIFNLLSGKYSPLNWLALVLSHRMFRISSPWENMAVNYIKNNFMPDTEGFDIIIGMRADDSYFSFAKAFINGKISLEQFKYVMVPGPSGEQFVLKTEKAFEKLEFKGFEKADSAIYYPRRKIRDLNALAGYEAEIELSQGGLFIGDILREEIKADDERL